MAYKQFSTHSRRIAHTALIVLGISCTSLQAQSVSEGQAVIHRAQFVEDIGASQRIDFSGKLRMLSQRIVAAGCNYAAGIDPERSGAMLRATSEEFQRIVDALEYGDPDLGIIGVEERRRTLVGISKLRTLWDPTNETAQLIAQGHGSPELVEQLADQSAPLLEMAKLLVSEVSAQYSDPTALLQADALAIDIAGRQRMLSQRMSKNVCLIRSDINTATATGELEGAMQMFEVSLMALRHGMPDAGIKEPPNDEIVAGLDVVIADWDALKPIVGTVLAKQSIDEEQRAIMFNGALAMTGHMNTVVGLYSEASKLGI
ncbi:type IV pili methyl-accepting chemotaxis transducer N-terminal domain-containing protein [Cognatiyoonia sp. IB215446]|uniref:type IV pili methyl-accepting chemotaxis transducer N-terminal domain-containing protein n=1 Tax=Cognatiyoonia sp. IB215446 TaxID=3097355 RepID=UPI002A0F2CB0|nr:type IV pili methyl-accepting chemotaxis transducer N-terminal domain-containing protein [Cognatiyoonia sp. IB215446]MDX8347875.1 type IV pili methyl-accepting chemotaxis transducer N-terminal domain-containing protein [Cognatiyoonia sp. IB215446]